MDDEKSSIIYDKLEQRNSPERQPINAGEIRRIPKPQREREREKINKKLGFNIIEREKIAILFSFVYRIEERIFILYTDLWLGVSNSDRLSCFLLFNFLFFFQL